MNKWCLGLLVVSFLWISKLTYDQQQYVQAIDGLRSQVTRTEQSINHVNDQMVAAQRIPQVVGDDHKNKPIVTTTKEKINEHGTSSSESHQSLINPILPIQQALELVQFALNQQQRTYALEHLQQLIQSLDRYNISPALKQSLYTSLMTDQQQIEAFDRHQQAQLNYANKLLLQVDQELLELLDKGVESYQPPQQKSFVEKLISIQPLNQMSTDLVSQRLVVKEIQLRLLLANQQLNMGQYDDYTTSIDEVLLLMKQAPRFNQDTLREQLEIAKKISFDTTPKLHTPTLLN
ncbi:hypothetical protein [Acinetobacter pollinis]|uniref:Uncharacterized protein n=1 Tax=Acinetobacter pollinis TaxID=2605270 RepID=A0ABU6DSC8_9GAMM|nr:hypothetical protein [Acinetobacter pollinis]MEB5476744.1 hypothetical protein [Acinetobacter pollinis]